MALIALALALLQDGDWPAWRGPRGDGHAPPGPPPPTTWSATEHVLWKAAVPGRGHGSPIVRGERVFLATCDETTDSQSLLCYDRATGRGLWAAEVHKGGAMRKNAKSTSASSTPACDGERVYITFANADAAWCTALSLDGKIAWQTKFSGYQVHQGYGASPFLYRGLVLVAADHHGGGALAALDAATGKTVWTRERPKAPNYPSPVVVAVGGRDQLILTGCDLVTSVDPLTGQVLWEVPGATTECVTTTVTDGVRVFTSGGYPKNHLSAVMADGSGKIAWEIKDRVYVPSLIAREGLLFGVLDAGVAVCWASDSGQELWKERLGGTFSASPVLVGDRIYVTNEVGVTFIYEARHDEFKLVSRNKLGDEAFATPVIAGGRIYMRVAERAGTRRQEALFCLGETK